MKFDEILENLESDGKILDFRFSNTQIPMYLMIRFMLIQSLINKEFNLSNPHVKVNKKSLKEIFKYIYYTLKSNLYFAPKKDIYIFSSGIVNKFENKKYTNRLYDEFYQLFKDKTQIIESSVKLSYLLPKKEKIYFRDLIDIIIILCSKTKKLKKDEIDEIDIFLEYLKNKEIFNYDNSIFSDIKKTLIKIRKRMSISFLIYRQFLKIKKPRVIIVEDAHYFGHLALLLEAKKLGIKTVEYQHGYVGLSHPSYNYHKSIFDNIKTYLPEYFLTHGNYWNEVTRTPSHKVQIGLADLSNKIDKIRITEKISNKILFISGGTVFEELNQLIEKSLIALKALDYEILLRPHPSEIPEIEIRYLNLIKKGVKIDTSNLYDTLQNVEVVVGMEVSTVLYEAVCFINKVYMMNTNYTNFYEPKSAFISFNDDLELVKSIKESKVLEKDINYFWNSDWKQNYINFIENTIGILK
ncbi:hypothetical protein [Aliarcobacter lanthieri]|uniref:hypothetical protein n=1 Tax=Aliarcobacter lanthieri TaxID=1355374 RepID=UPI00047C758C|nr:hypothetical protein [Aliarcobacter lanthieri]QKF58963.1 hypothetical protein ALANTH_0848 [Aliarcobacter lanthieri]